MPLEAPRAAPRLAGAARGRLPEAAGYRIRPPGQEERFQVVVKALPLLFSALGWSRTVPPELTCVISSSVKEEMVPVEDPSVAELPVSDQVPKSVSGSMPLEPLGASAIHSALLLAPWRGARGPRLWLTATW